MMVACDYIFYANIKCKWQLERQLKCVKVDLLERNTDLANCWICQYNAIEENLKWVLSDHPCAKHSQSFFEELKKLFHFTFRVLLPYKIYYCLSSFVKVSIFGMSCNGTKVVCAKTLHFCSPRDVQWISISYTKGLTIYHLCISFPRLLWSWLSKVGLEPNASKTALGERKHKAILSNFMAIKRYILEI